MMPNTFLILWLAVVLAFVESGENGPSCPHDCRHVPYDPQCGSDGKTYDNGCLLAKATCMTWGNTTMLHKGECTGQDYHCPHECPDVDDPMCGTDGNTYDNPCKLGFATCMTGGNVKIKNLGPCIATPSCPFNCPDVVDPRCGTDGNTYSNGCFLGEASCLTKGNVTLKHKGPCSGDDRNCPQDCTEGDYEPVCGTDGKTYNNNCMLGFQRCMTNGGVDLAHKGIC